MDAANHHRHARAHPGGLCRGSQRSIGPLPAHRGAGRWREIEAFAAELIDRFGPLPAEVENLLEIIAIKRLCRDAGVEKVEAGPKGAVIAFHRDRFANPRGLVDFLQEHAGTAKLRPDQRLVVVRDWEETRDRLRGINALLRRLAELAAAPAEPLPAPAPAKRAGSIAPRR